MRKTLFVLLFLIILILSIGMAFAQDTKKDELEPHHIQVLRQLRTKVEGWLKDINDRIEGEDVTRFEVRFLEILRSLLEWVRDKMDAQIESWEKRPKEREENI